MKRVVVSVFDSAVQTYGQPIVMPAVGAALRSFTDEVNRPGDQNPLHNHPEDFELRLLAMFDDETGIFQAPSEGVGYCLLRGKDAKQVVQ